MPVAVSVVLPKSHGAKKQAAATPTKTAELIVITEYIIVHRRTLLSIQIRKADRKHNVLPVMRLSPVVDN